MFLLNVRSIVRNVKTHLFSLKPTTVIHWESHEGGRSCQRSWPHVTLSYWMEGKVIVKASVRTVLRTVLRQTFTWGCLSLIWIFFYWQSPFHNNKTVLEICLNTIVNFVSSSSFEEQVPFPCKDFGSVQNLDSAGLYNRQHVDTDKEALCFLWITLQ